MPITVQWENDDHRIIRQTFTGNWTWQEFIHACIDDDGNAGLMRSVSNTVHVISDFTHSGPIPFGGAISQSRSAMRHYPSNWGTLTVVTTNPFVRSLVNAFRRTYPRGFGAKTFAAATIDEAYGLIAEWERRSAVTPG